MNKLGEFIIFLSFIIFTSCKPQELPLGSWLGDDMRLELFEENFTMYFDAEDKAVTRISGTLEYLESREIQMRYDNVLIEGQWKIFAEAMGTDFTETIKYALKDDRLVTRNSDGSIFMFIRNN